ncbi:Hypothetical protein A7982_04275 [Minicystis rosea]|nr:Hypothetical protein A7982_04275 [Minicystis rosea]
MRMERLPPHRRTPIRDHRPQRAFHDGQAGPRAPPRMEPPWQYGCEHERNATRNDLMGPPCALYEFTRRNLPDLVSCRPRAGLVNRLHLERKRVPEQGAREHQKPSHPQPAEHHVEVAFVDARLHERLRHGAERSLGARNPRSTASSMVVLSTG